MPEYGLRGQTMTGLPIGEESWKVTDALEKAKGLEQKVELRSSKGKEAREQEQRVELRLQRHIAAARAQKRQVEQSYEKSLVQNLPETEKDD
jgi:hypothetical protein